MPRIVTYLDEDSIQNIRDLCKNSSKPISKIISELIEAGYQIKQRTSSNPQNEKILELSLKQIEYSLRILNICSEILRKIHDEPSRLPGRPVDSMLSEIKKYSKNVVKSVFL